MENAKFNVNETNAQSPSSAIRTIAWNKTSKNTIKRFVIRFQIYQIIDYPFFFEP